MTTPTAFATTLKWKGAPTPRLATTTPRPTWTTVLASFPTGFCDCASTVLDTDNDGVCDDEEVDGCDDPFACNYDSDATENDGSCEYCSCSEFSIHLVCGVRGNAYNSDLNVYRLYVNTLDAAMDELSAVYSNAQEPLVLNVPEGIYNHPQGSWNASGVNPGMFQDFPGLVDDSYVTIGLDGPAPLDGDYHGCISWTSAMC